MDRCSYSRKGFTPLRPLRGLTGFTIIELLSATVIMALVIGGSMAIYIMSLTAWKEGGVQIALQRKASITMEKIVRGIGGLGGIREASNVELSVSNTKIEYWNTSDIGSPERSFYISNNEIKYDSDTSVTGTDPSIAKNVTGLTFAVSGDVVTINLSMAEQVMDNTVTINLTTLVNLRN